MDLKGKEECRRQNVEKGNIEHQTTNVQFPKKKNAGIVPGVD